MIRSISILTLVYLLTAPLSVLGQDEPELQEPEIDESIPPELTGESMDTIEMDEDIGMDEMDADFDAESMEEASPEEEIPDLEMVMPDSDVEIDFGEDAEGEGVSRFEMETKEVGMIEFQTEAEREAAREKEQETISVDFPDEEIRIIIRNVAELYEINVVIPDTLVGSTSLKLRNVTWDQVFRVVLEPIGFTYIRERNIIKIKSNEDVLQEPVTTRIFVIDFATAAELQASIAPLVDSAAGGRIQVDSRSNALVITERPTRMNDIQGIIERLDRPTAQVMIESKFVEVTNRDVKNIGVNWASLNSYNLVGGPFNRSYTRSKNQTRGDSDGTIDNTTDNTNTVDTNTTTISTNATLPGGFTSTTGISNNSTTTATDTIDSSINRALNLVNSATEGKVDTAVFSADAFSVVLSALETLSDTELISNPTVVTMNNTPAQINIGSEHPIPSYTYNDERGTFEVSGFEYKPIGIILKVTPQVNSAGFINLNIAPEVSSQTGTVNFGGTAAAEIPIIATRKTQSTIMIKDGFTLAIGGLIERNINNSETKVPILGDIPVIGRFFRSQSDTEDRRNLIIFITAKTLNPDGSTYMDVFSPATLNTMGVSSHDVPGAEIPENQARLYAQIQELRDSLKSMNKEEKLRKQIDALRGFEQRGNVKAIESRAYKKKRKRKLSTISY